MKTYKIGIYKNGQQIAKEVFASTKLSEIKEEFKRMYKKTKEKCWGNPLGLSELKSFKQAWHFKHFREDTNNVAVFITSGENEGCYTNWIYQGITSNQL